MNGDRSKHDRTLDDLVIRVKYWQPESKVIPHFIYQGCEADALQYWLEDELFHFNSYEVKCNRTMTAEAKSKEQLLRLENYLHRQFKRERHEVNSYSVFGCTGTYMLVKLGDKAGPEFTIGQF